MRTLFIQIDGNSLRQDFLTAVQEYEDVKILNFMQVNSFISFMGYSLVDKLTDDYGKPLCRLIVPVGSILKTYQNECQEQFNELLAYWFVFHSNILHYGHPLFPDSIKVDDDQIVDFKLSYQFTEWLLSHENSLYNIIGENLKSNGQIIEFDMMSFYDDFIISLLDRIKRYLSEFDIDNIVFSNPVVNKSSYISQLIFRMSQKAKIISIDNWYSLHEEKLTEVIASLKYAFSFRLNNIILGITKEEELPDNSDKYQNYSLGHLDEDTGVFIHTSGGMVDRLYFHQKMRKNSDKEMNKILSLLMGYNCSYEDLCFKQISGVLCSRGFKISKNPMMDKTFNERFIDGKLTKQGLNYSCELHFFHQVLNDMDLERYNPYTCGLKKMYAKGTLYTIDVVYNVPK